MQLNAWFSHFKKELESKYSSREIEQFHPILMDYYLGYNRADLVLRNQESINELGLHKLQLALEKLKENMPIDYILNQSIFFGREFYVDSRVLVPRSETEELVQLILEQEKGADIELLDIGTGSGCIPISLALERNYKRIDACEVSKDAMDVAIENGKKLQAEVNWYLLDILIEKPKQTYDVVISNPPYVRPEELNTLDKNVQEYEPHIALAPKEDPLEFYKRMLHIAEDMIKPGGRLYWEIHEDLGQEVLQLMKPHPFTNIQLIQDMYGRDRFVSAVFLP